MEIWNSKSSDNMYFDFKETFGVLPEVHFGQAIYRFEALKVTNLILLNNVQIGVEMRKLYAFDPNWSERNCNLSAITKHQWLLKNK